jgi:hypothetical protein
MRGNEAADAVEWFWNNWIHFADSTLSMQQE